MKPETRGTRMMLSVNGVGVSSTGVVAGSPFNSRGSPMLKQECKVYEILSLRWYVFSSIAGAGFAHMLDWGLSRRSRPKESWTDLGLLALDYPEQDRIFQDIFAETDSYGTLGHIERGNNMGQSKHVFPEDARPKTLAMPLLYGLYNITNDGVGGRLFFVRMLLDIEYRSLEVETSLYRKLELAYYRS